MVLEVCANSYTSALAAQEGGAIRVELCGNLAEGGITPSYAQIKLCKNKLTLQVWPIIRPRSGDFLYSEDEFEVMKEDIKICKALNCDGVVTGILTTDGNIDKARMTQLIELAKPMPLAFHRAFDMANDLKKALEDLISLGIVRVLTSGGAENAFKGIDILSNLVIQANGRIEIMPGAGINANNIAEIAKTTGAKCFHTTAKMSVESKMQYKNHIGKMGKATDEFSVEETDLYKVKHLIEVLNNM